MSPTRYFKIGTFRVDANFGWEWIDGRTGVVQMTAAEGTLRTYTNFVNKERAAVTLQNLTQDEADDLKAELEKIGADAIHPVEYMTPGGLRLWDGASLPSTGTNNDLVVPRVRQKMFVEAGWTIQHHDQLPNNFYAKMTLTEV